MRVETTTDKAVHDIPLKTETAGKTAQRLIRFYEGLFDQTYLRGYY